MPNDADDLPVNVFWDELTTLQRHEPSPAPNYPPASPGDLVIGNAQRILVTIKATGELQYGEGYTPDDAASVFWNAMAQRRIQLEERFLIIDHMESILVQLGRADRECERLRQEAHEEADPIRKAGLQQMAELAMRRLDMVAHQAIELGRALSRRDVPAPPVPEAVPATLQQDPDNQYIGREGLPEEPTN